jgi:hypothetical protein
MSQLGMLCPRYGREGFGFSPRGGLASVTGGGGSVSCSSGLCGASVLYWVSLPLHRAVVNRGTCAGHLDYCAYGCVLLVVPFLFMWQ